MVNKQGNQRKDAEKNQEREDNELDNDTKKRTLDREACVRFFKHISVRHSVEALDKEDMASIDLLEECSEKELIEMGMTRGNAKRIVVYFKQVSGKTRRLDRAYFFGLVDEKGSSEEAN